MRFLTRYIVFIFLLSACVSNDRDERSRDTSAVEIPAEHQLTSSEKLEDYLLALDSNDIASVNKATTKYIELFDEKDSIENDKGVVLILRYMEMITMNASGSAFEEGVNYRPLVGVEAEGGEHDVPSELSDAYAKINQNGFRVRETEGMFTLEINPFFIQEIFYAYISPNFEIYLQQLGKENLEGFAEDAAIAIPFQNLVQRVIWWEEFAHNTQNTSVGLMAKKQYDKYFNCLTIGMDNTPAIESEQLAPYFQQAYTYLKDFAPQSDTYQKLQPYIALLQDQKLEEAKAMLPDLIRNDFNG